MTYHFLMIYQMLMILPGIHVGIYMDLCDCV